MIRAAVGVFCAAVCLMALLGLVHEGLRASGVIRDQVKNSEREYDERGGLSAREYRQEDATHE